MAISEAWNENKPAGGDDPKQGDDEIRQERRALREGLRHGGHEWESGSGTNAQRGRHKVFDSGDTDVLDANNLVGEWYVWDGPGTGKVVRVRDSSAAGTPKPALEMVGNGYLIGRRETTMTLALPAAGTGRVAGIIFENRGNDVLTILEVRAIAFTAPSGSALDIDINVLASGFTDPGAAGTSIFAVAGDHPTVAAGAKVGAVKTTFADATLAVGEAWVFDIDALNSANDIVLVFKVWRP